jgi:hypothetical protein
LGAENQFFSLFLPPYFLEDLLNLWIVLEARIKGPDKNLVPLTSLPINIKLAFLEGAERISDLLFLKPGARLSYKPHRDALLAVQHFVLQEPLFLS